MDTQMAVLYKPNPSPSVKSQLELGFNVIQVFSQLYVWGVCDKFKRSTLIVFTYFSDSSK